MNTKIIVALVIGIAVIGLTGVASARTSTSSIYYDFVKTVEGNGIYDVVTDLDNLVSTAGWSYDDPSSTYQERAFIQNTLENTWATPAGDPDGIYHAKVIQAGTASITTRDEDSEDADKELEIKMAKAQDVIVSGQFKAFGAVFSDNASVGVNYFDPITSGTGDLSVSGCGNCHATEVSNAWGRVISSGDAKISEAAVGTESWTSLAADGWTRDVFMDGGSSAYSEFYGDSLVGNTPVDAGLDDIGASIQTEAYASAVHTWNSHGGMSPQIP